MKSLYGWITLLLAVIMLLFPLVPAKKIQSNNITPTDNNITVEKDDTLNIYLTESQTVQKINAKDYIFGVVAAEMPALYSDEAIKAQAVAAYTFAIYRKSENTDKEYDITDSHITDQSFISKEQAAEKWGEDAQTYIEKIENAIDSVFGQKILYENKPILAVYTAISGGRTESSQNVWEKSLPYLTPVDSIGDLLCPDYLSSASFSTEEIKTLLCDKQKITAPAEQWFSTPKHSESGTVLTMKFGEKELSGTAIRDALSLKSANFEVTFADNTFTFSVRGYGHLCGMSQYGAHYMALQGSTYKEILTHYYTGCVVE